MVNLTEDMTKATCGVISRILFEKIDQNVQIKGEDGKVIEQPFSEAVDRTIQ
jgi:hypothetical protein